MTIDEGSNLDFFPFLSADLLVWFAHLFMQLLGSNCLGAARRLRVEEEGPWGGGGAAASARREGRGRRRGGDGGSASARGGCGAWQCSPGGGDEGGGEVWWVQNCRSITPSSARNEYFGQVLSEHNIYRADICMPLEIDL